ncbi:MAG: hypothetical protein KAI08_06835 [Bacteroidales bacterium]|nr:hypothetical protein [Bacteroidales bacterium]
MHLLVLIGSGLIHVGHAQSPYDSAYAEMAKQRPEKLIVFTDRSIYAVNETIHFSALLQSGAYPYPDPGSEVLYAELVNSSGEAVAKGKFPISENWSAGHISIPPTIASGTYYLRSYTRWMRNFGSQDFSYIPIRVVNPYSTEVAANDQIIGKDILTPMPRGARMINISTARHSYGAGEMVDVVLSLKEGYIKQLLNACVTVVPSGAIDTSIFLHKVDPKPEKPAQFQFKFLPEIDGTTISGVVLQQSNRKPAPDARIHFSILGEDPAYFVTQSDQQGRFLISTPLRLGNQEMFVFPEVHSETPVEVRIDNDFSSDPLPFQPGSFTLPEDEQLLASRLSLQMQLQWAFMAESVIDSANLVKRDEQIPFYGKPEISVELDEFINLPNLEEVFINLIPKTYVMRRRGSIYFMIQSENPMISWFPPLILIDHIPVLDMEIIMAIPPSKIDHIEVVPEVYVKGDVKYGGIISLTSRQGDLAGIKLPEGSYFFDYSAFQPSLSPLYPKYSGPGKIPDTRNTLLWMDHLELHKDTSCKVSFQAASVPGTYLILFRGVSPDGNIVHGLKQIEVE